MKRIKIMLTAITVLAIVGGALAFKAQKFSMKRICSGDGPEKENCQNLTSTTTVFTEGTQSFYYTKVADNATNCNAVISCPTQTYLTTEQ